MFERVRNATMGVQGAATVGTTQDDYLQKVQALAVAISTAKDHRLNEREKALAAAYVEALEGYRLAAVLWALKIRADASGMYHGEIPVQFTGQRTSTLPEALLKKYNLPVAQRTTSMKQTFGAVPPNAVERVWSIANREATKANTLYVER